MVQKLVSLSDRDLILRIRESLSATGRPELSRLDVDLKAGVVTLSGIASSWYARQLALHCVLQNAQAVRVRDEIQVVPNGTGRALGDES